MFESVRQLDIPDSGCPWQSMNDELRADIGRDAITMLPGTNASPPG